MCARIKTHKLPMTGGHCSTSFMHRIIVNGLIVMDIRADMIMILRIDQNMDQNRQ